MTSCSLSVKILMVGMVCMENRTALTRNRAASTRNKFRDPAGFTHRCPTTRNRANSARNRATSARKRATSVRNKSDLTTSCNLSVKILIVWMVCIIGYMEQAH